MPAVLQGIVLFLVGSVIIYGLIASISAKQGGQDKAHGGGHGGHH